ncbi:isopeptide-forming domain-containing fimbrial protein [Ruminococcus sp. AM29-19LB]|jgi:fimbrial isopeptide formation D2 family protein/LPXTG-motif cell wall-anchored protein|nr:isopeptide-forming domain-containing fimbrial protein [Ruminococcus sp. AF19-4LB]RGH67011.1 isopeptide-forming domain-containing fimbrial protein [Ruminococcus sp. AM29-5AC]RGH69763.1 isopeptide-forming domain-containing fimbrial protein [Ruminococcus sp. AM29-1LB]RGH74115.1 isopeptide-forming domain-containing fimbrial protein [Ruminococcus sp. AM29-19LB]RGH76831.1 isopeptide-forming domain-containing fimbrial protein [Ruminococcus sp. AM29-10LB]RGH77509.1 isopeptide-forming domain-contain
MKRMKKIMAVLLAAIMTMAMAVTAFADNVATTTTGTNKLTVNVKTGDGVPTQTLKDQTINLYKLFDVTESKSGETTNYAYTVNDTYKSTLASVLNIVETSKDEEFAAAVTKLGSDNATAVQKFANDFTAEALTKKLSATATSNKIEESKTAYTFSNLAAGYYLVYVTGGKEIQSSLVTVDATNSVNLKTEAPSIEKKADKETVSIGQVVKYTVTGSIPDTTGYDQYQYIIHDELSKGLDFVKNADGDALDKATEANVTIAFTESGITPAGTTPTSATLSGEGNRTMALDLSAWVKANQTNKGKVFTVTYYAKVNANAVVTEKNSAQLEYGNKPDETTTTTPSEAKTPTYPLNILKKKKGSEDKLAGAKFKLYSSEADANANDAAKAIKVSPVVAGVAGNYVVDPESSTTEFESVASIDEKGYNLHVNGLAAGDYWLVETEAPAGYNKLTAPIKVTIEKSTDAVDANQWTLKDADGKKIDSKIVTIENSTGSLLPSTGGMGTIIFAVIAAILVLGVAVSFIRDKRKNA